MHAMMLAMLPCFTIYARSYVSAPTGPRQVRRQGQTSTKDERREFMGVFPDIVRELTADPSSRIPDVEKWFHKVSAAVPLLELISH